MKKILFILAILLAAPVLRAADDEIFDPPTPPDPGAAYVVNLESSIPEAALLDGSGAYRKGEYVTITCQPHEGFRFQQWIANGEALSTFPAYTFQMPDHSLNIVAKLVQLTKQTLTINTNIEGAAITTGAGEYYSGDTVAIHCTIHEDYVFLYWTLDNDVYSYDQDITFTMGETPQVLTAVCKHVPVGIISVRSDDEQAGQVSSNGGIYLVGTELTYYATPLDGYTFSHWEIDGEHYSDTDTILYTVTDQNVEIRAFFDFSPDTPDDPALELTSIIHIVSEPLNAATFNLQSGNHYMEGDTLFISAHLQDNYRLDGWYINGQCVSTAADLIYVVGRKDETIVLRATELKIQTLVLVSMPENAVTFNMPAYSNVRATDNVTIQATVDANYLFDGWYENNELISNALTIQYEMPNRVATLIAKAHPINDSDEFDPAPPSEPDLETALISAYPNSAFMGQVTGAATYVIGDTITLQATPLYGYYFVNWSDGYEQTTRTIIVEEDITLIANFAPYTFSIQANANDSKMGQVTGAGTYPYHSYPTLRAIPYEEYEFVKWSDGSIFDEYTIHVVSDTILTAIFQQKEYLLDISSSNDQAGQTLGAGRYHRGDTVTITAIPNQGYNFVKWSDGDTTIIKTIIIDGAMSFVAHFAAQKYTIQASSNDENMGWVIGAGVYAYDSHPTLKAMGKPGYELQAWSNGVTDTEYTLHLTSDTTLIANFQIKRYNVNITASNDVAGQVTGTGTYLHGDTITITATPNYGYEFLKWSDGNTNASRTITAEADLALVAKFTPMIFTIQVTSEDKNMGQVSGGGAFPYNSYQTLLAIPNEGYEFVRWSDGNTQAERVVVVNEGQTYTAYFVPKQYDISLTVNDNQMGYVRGDGTYAYATDVEITAIPYFGYHFDQWSDGNDTNPRVVHLTNNTNLTAIFHVAQSINETATICYGEEYLWHGTIYNTSGIFTAIADNKIDTLFLTVLPEVPTTEVSDTICYGETYTWHGETYTESGDYSDTLSNINGCDSIVNLHLTINKRDTVHYYETACDEYWWNPYGQYYNTSGDYENYTTNEYGCDRVEILHLTINRSEREEYWEFACDAYEWHGSAYTETGEYEYRSTLDNGCERVEVLHLTIYNSQYEEYWETACDEYWWHGNQYTESGDYTYSYPLYDWGTGTCDRTEVLHLTINKRDTVHYYETACDEYWWNPYGQYYNTSGDYENYTTNEYGCDRVEILHLTINRSEREEYWEFACDAYEWHGSAYTESGDYEYRSILDNGCERVEVLHLTIYNSQYEEYWETACDEYWWHGNQYTESGDYTYSYPLYNWGTGTCDRTEVLHLTINKRDTVHYYETACDEYWWNPYGQYYNTSGDYENYTTNEYGCDRVEILHLTILSDATTESEKLALCPSELPYEWYGQILTEAGSYTATEPYAGMECDSVIHALTLDVYVQTLPSTITMPIVRTGEAIDVSIPTAEIQAHIAAKTWYAPNAEVAWYIMDNGDWGALTDEPVATGIEEVILKYTVETDCGNVESDKMVITVEKTDVEYNHIQSPISNCQKILYEDHIYILRDGKVYSVMGHEL